MGGVDRQERECLLHVEEVEQRHKEVLGKLEAIERRLFKDNGTLSIQTRLERHEQILKVLVWATSVVGGALLTSSVTGMVLLVKWVLTHGGTP